MKEEEIEVKLYSEEFQDVLGNIPHWIVRRGIILLLVIVVLAIASCSIIKYPDTITTTMVLTGNEPAVDVVARSTGKIKELFIKNNQEVAEGDCLAILDNLASTADIGRLRKYLGKLDIEKNIVLPDESLVLGDIQGAFMTFYSVLKEYGEFCESNYYPNKIKFMNERVTANLQQLVQVKKQVAIAKHQLELNRKKISRDSLLHRDNVLALEEYENSYRQYLQSSLSYENICLNGENMELQIIQMKEAIYDVENQYFEKKNSLKGKIINNLRLLVTEIDNWQMRYALLAPINGKIAFVKFWTENQNVTMGDEVFSIIPSHETPLVGKALLPMEGSGKVVVGQKVNVRFDNFPDREFGKVKGVVGNISLVPIQQDKQIYYSIDILFPQGLKTSYGKELPFLPRMNGKADVITDDLTLLERIFLPVRKLWDDVIK